MQQVGVFGKKGDQMSEERPGDFSVDAPDEFSEELPKKKRYYTPGEARQRKGCVGCGSMVLVALGLLPVLLLAGGLR